MTGTVTGFFRNVALGVVLCLGGLAPGIPSILAASGGDVQFEAQVDRPQIGDDESVSLKLSIRVNGAGSLDEPRFDAPDFDVVNEFNSTFVESYYEGGKFGVRNNRQITKVLRPRKTGRLQISGIQVRVNDRNYSAPSISVQVTPGGAGSPPPKGYGGGPSVGLRGAGKAATGKPFFLRAEVDKDKVFKGEQIVVSYYLYRRVKVFNIQVDKYPTLNGFLREDLQMPVLGNRLQGEQVLLEGVPYQRSLLLQYAAYPLQEGKLTVDSLDARASYFQTQMEDDDPFANFFTQFSAKIATLKSEYLTVEVSPLPTDGRPATFSGGVGDFNVMSAVDKYEVRANEAVNLTVKIEGRGNVAALGEPKTAWPDGVELYDTKSRAKSGKGGVGEKVFEFLLIPRSPGKLTIPRLEFSFFDPAKSQYVTRSTEPIDLTVHEAAPGSVAPPVPKGASVQGAGKPGGSRQDPQLLPILPPGGGTGGGPVRAQAPWLRWLPWLGLGSFGVLFGWIAVDSARRKRGAGRPRVNSARPGSDKSWDKLAAASRNAAAGAPWVEVLTAYEQLAGLVYDALDRKFGVGARSVSRKDLKRILVEEQGLHDGHWSRISRLLEFSETVRYAVSAKAVSEQTARTQLEKWVAEGKLLVDNLGGV